MIYYRLSLFVILLLRFMVGLKSELGEAGAPLPAARQRLRSVGGAMPWCGRLLADS